MRVYLWRPKAIRSLHSRTVSASEPICYSSKLAIYYIAADIKCNFVILTYVAGVKN